MPFDETRAAAQLDDNIDELRAYLTDDDDLIDRYRTAFTAVPEEWAASEIHSELTRASYPGALPTEQFDAVSALVQPHYVSDEWESHEAVNDWARDVLSDVPILAVDGSEIQPTTQFNLAVAYIQAAWCINHHAAGGRLERGIDGRLLTPIEISREGEQDDYQFVDSSLVGEYRYEHEGNVWVEQIEALATARDSGELEQIPVVIYDGPLVLSFANNLDPASRERYVETMSEVVAASQHHDIPLVGYVAGTNATDLVKMMRRLLEEEFETDRVIADSRVLNGMMSPWGDYTVPFLCRRDGSVDALETEYENEMYAFDDDLMFSYLKVPPGNGLDRIEFPGWITRTDGPDGYETLFEYTLDVVRAEAGIGRGYPEVLQQADADAVLTQTDRQRFLRLLQRWADANDVPLEWDAKTLSKERRRR